MTHVSNNSAARRLSQGLKNGGPGTAAERMRPHMRGAHWDAGVEMATRQLSLLSAWTFFPQLSH